MVRFLSFFGFEAPVLEVQNVPKQNCIETCPKDETFIEKKKKIRNIEYFVK